MQRSPLWIVMIVGLYAGCVTHPVSEAQAVADRAVHTRPSNDICKLPQISYCEGEVDGTKHCTCVNRRDVFGPQ